MLSRLRGRPSILRRLFMLFITLGVAIAMLFPFYAEFFVNWKPGMYPWFFAGCVLAGATIGVINYYLVKLILVSKLNRLSTLSRAITQQDLSKNCVIESHDVIGDIVQSVNMMIDTLRNLIRQIHNEAEALNGAANNMSVVMNASVEETQTQHDKIEQVATAMNQMAASAQEVARNADEAAEATENADEQGNTGKVVVVEAMSAVDMLADMVDQATTVIKNLEKESENISAVLGVINGIAEQTNLLALNAAIEAARAGEQGRGFAVVADEVRTLATRTQESTEEISAMIERLQSGSRDAVNAMSSGSDQARRGVELSEQAAEALAEIAGSITMIKDMSHQIANAAQEQNSVIEDVNQSIVQISDTSVHAREGMQQVAGTSQEVSSMANDLHQLVAGFKLN